METPIEKALESLQVETAVDNDKGDVKAATLQLQPSPQGASSPNGGSNESPPSRTPPTIKTWRDRPSPSSGSVSVAANNGNNNGNMAYKNKKKQGGNNQGFYNPQQQQMMQQQQGFAYFMPAIPYLPPPSQYFAVDVECVASGKQRKSLAQD
jgi:hypothetical protein